jgi:protein disulfide-isomerase
MIGRNVVVRQKCRIATTRHDASNLRALHQPRRRVAVLLSLSVVVTIASGCEEIAAPVQAEEGVHWSNELVPAWNFAIQNRRPLLIYIHSQNCLYCRKMEAEFTNGQLATHINTNFVAVALDAKAAGELNHQAGVQAYPTTLVISPDQLLLDRIEGYLPVTQFQQRTTLALRRER